MQMVASMGVTLDDWHSDSFKKMQRERFVAREEELLKWAVVERSIR